MLSYMLDHTLWGLNSFGYHLQNIFWHIVATLAIYNCFRLFNIKSWIAFFICLIFAVHPQRVESVVWLSERKDVLCAAFYFLSIYFYIKNYDKKFSFAAFAFFLLSILSKSMAISLPVILLLYEFYRQRNFNLKHYFSKLWPYFLISIIFIPITIAAQGETIHSSRNLLTFDRFYSILYNGYWYIKQTISPSELNPIYPLTHPFYYVTEIILFYFGALVFTIIAFFKSKKLFIYKILPLILAYIAVLLPIIGLIRLGSIDHADRYSYIPSVLIWFSLGLVLSISQNAKDRQLVSKKQHLFKVNFTLIILFFYTCFLIVSNYQYQKVWKNEHSLFFPCCNFDPNQ